MVEGEEKYIYPFSDKADYSINTFHSYETALLKPYAIKLLDEIESTSPFFEKACAVKKYLENTDEYVSSSLVPTDSLLREFIG